LQVKGNNSNFASLSVGHISSSSSLLTFTDSSCLIGSVCVWLSIIILKLLYVLDSAGICGFGVVGGDGSGMKSKLNELSSI